jgi:hypothetical protein
VNVTQMLRRAAILSADLRAVRRSMQTGSAKPLIRRGKNKAIGRLLGRATSRLWRWPR